MEQQQQQQKQQQQNDGDSVGNDDGVYDDDEDMLVEPEPLNSDGTFGKDHRSGSMLERNTDDDELAAFLLNDDDGDGLVNALLSMNIGGDGDAATMDNQSNINNDDGHVNGNTNSMVNDGDNKTSNDDGDDNNKKDTEARYQQEGNLAYAKAVLPSMDEGGGGGEQGGLHLNDGDTSKTAAAIENEFFAGGGEDVPRTELSSSPLPDIDIDYNDPDIAVPFPEDPSILTTMFDHHNNNDTNINQQQQLEIVEQEDQQRKNHDGEDSDKKKSQEQQQEHEQQPDLSYLYEPVRDPIFATTTTTDDGDRVNDDDNNNDNNDMNVDPNVSNEELLNRFVESLSLGNIDPDSLINVDDMTEEDLNPEVLLRDLAQLAGLDPNAQQLPPQLLPPPPPAVCLPCPPADTNAEEGDDTTDAARTTSTTDLVPATDRIENEPLPPGMYPYCIPCSDEAYEEQEGVQNDYPDAQQPRADNNSSIVTSSSPLQSIAEDRPQRTREEEIAELQALYVNSRRQTTMKGSEIEQLHANNIDGIDLDPNDPLVQQIRASIEKEDPEIPGWWNTAERWASGFGVDLSNAMGISSSSSSSSKGNDSLCRPISSEKVCMGHKEKIFGVTFSPDGKYMASASQDSTVVIWNVETNSIITKLQGHSKAYECLRVDWASFQWSYETVDREGQFRNLIASSGADGVVKIWSTPQPNESSGNWKCEFTLDHAKLLNRGIGGGDATNEKKKEDDEVPAVEDDKPQVYALQFIDHWKVFTDEMEQAATAGVSNDSNAFLLTSADEYIHLWEVEKHPFDQQLQNANHDKIRILQDKEIKLKEVMSLHFGSLDAYGYGVTPCSITGEGLNLPPPPVCSKHQADSDDIAFGGERNPRNIVYVFDASYCRASGLLGVALADGSLRLVNGRGTCVSVFNLPGSGSHLTSLGWDASGSRLATSVATGHVILWGLDRNQEEGNEGADSWIATCLAIYEGGHEPMRPLFGTRFVGDKDDELLISWGVDGRLCLWNPFLHGNIYAPIAILKNDDKYPMYTLDVSPSGKNVAVGGGGEDSFIGTPLYLYSIPSE